MTLQRSIIIPDRSDLIFNRGIAHPELWLWDSWTVHDGNTIRLFCLAINRVDASGAPTTPAMRNEFPFHVRQFTSTDHGVSWRDCGVFQSPASAGDGGMARNVWSGSIEKMQNGEFVVGYTGLRELPENRDFLQTIYLGWSIDGETLDIVPYAPISCPIRDYDMIRDAGYYLGPKDSLGSNSGEEGGPILGWRDPFILRQSDSLLDVFWSAKISPAEGAVAHATISVSGRDFAIEKLHPPMTLPDAANVTQAEVPKIYQDAATGLYFMLVSACDRVSEDQPESEVSKAMRIYRSADIRGPWAPAGPDGTSAIGNAEHLFGCSIIGLDGAAGKVKMVSPLTEYASPDRRLTIAEVQTHDIAGEHEQVSSAVLQPKLFNLSRERSRTFSYNATECGGPQWPPTQARPRCGRHLRYLG